MEWLGRLLYRHTYDRVAYEPIREDFLRWYLELYEALHDNLESDNSQLITMAINSGIEAREYEPDTRLHSAINVIEGVKETVRYILAWVSVISGLCALTIFGVDAIDLIPSYLPYQSTVLRGIGILLVFPTAGYPFYILLVKTLELDEELIRQYNRELVISPGRVRDDERYPDKLISYYIWHSSLCSSAKQPVIVILGMIRFLWPRAYGYISYRITENMKGYRDDTLLKMLGREYQLFKRTKEERQIETSMR